MNWPSTFIDPAIPLDRSDRRRVQRDAWKRWMTKRGNLMTYGVGLVTAMMIFMFLPDWIDGIFGYHRWYFTVVAFGVYLGLLASLFLILRRYRFAPCVYAELRGRHFDVCMRCGYWLKGLDDDVAQCPECGATRSGLSPGE